MRSIVATLASAVQRHIGRWLGAYIAVVFAFTHFPKQIQPPVPGLPLDKIAHVFLYAGLGLLMAEYVRSRFRLSITRSAVLAVLACLAVGAADEITQPLADRVCDPIDFAADGVGALLGVAAHAASAAAGLFALRSEVGGRGAEVREVD